MRTVQATLSKVVTFVGVGVHSGKPTKITLKPAKENIGIWLVNAQDRVQRVRVGTVAPLHAMHATVIEHKRWRVSTVEHIMASLVALGIDNLYVEIDGEEVPILDGSSFPFVQGIIKSGVRLQKEPRLFLTPKQEIYFSDDDNREIIIKPARVALDGSIDMTLYIDYHADFSHPLIGSQKFTSYINAELFRDEIAPSRTFGFLSQLPFLHKHGLAQGTTLANTVVINDEEFLNAQRFSNECVRHKVLDLIGDLGLLGLPLIGTVVARKTGHNFNRNVILDRINHPEKWEMIMYRNT